LNAAKQVPHGGVLVDQMVKSEDAKKAAIAAATVTVAASDRQLCDLELIMNGGFSPLTGFMDEATYDNVVEKMELPDGNLFGLPVIYDTDDESLQPGTTILLTQGDLPIATIELTDKYTPNKALECKKVYGTSELEHPGSLMVATERGKYYMGGKVTGLNFPVRDFPCKTPAEVRAELPDDLDVVAFQCRNPVHRAHYELFIRALDDPLVGAGGIVLVHPTCGPTQVSKFIRIDFRQIGSDLCPYASGTSTQKNNVHAFLTNLLFSVIFRPTTSQELSDTRPMRF
jgi:sulfate adenylyltransferase